MVEKVHYLARMKNRPIHDSLSVTRLDILALAWPIVLANVAVPLLGLVDTAVIGNTGSVEDLGGIALGALVFGFVYWSFGFLRMGTTGFVAQASGADDDIEVRAAPARALLIAGGIGVILIAAQRPIAWTALSLLSATPEVEALTRSYFDVRIWGAPATLGTFAALGTFVGLGRTQHLLATQVVLNGLNIVLDILFAGVFGWGVEGIALGTAIAEWITFGFALFLMYRVLREWHTGDEPFWPWARVLDRIRAVATLNANADIMVRTLFLLMGVAWFTNQGARFGDDILAANHVLLQLVAMSVYVLDGYAHATEIVVGRAIGSGAVAMFDQAIGAATQLAAVTALALSGSMLLLGPWAIDVLTNLVPVRTVAVTYLPYTAIYIALSFPAFQLDGVFIGATGTRDMRNASILSFTAFLIVSLILIPRTANLGLWLAFIFYVVVRAVSLAIRYPTLRSKTAIHITS